jgi:hypothetical protein
LNIFQSRPICQGFARHVVWFEGISIGSDAWPQNPTCDLAFTSWIDGLNGLIWYRTELKNTKLRTLKVLSH